MRVVRAVSIGVVALLFYGTALLLAVFAGAESRAARLIGRLFCRIFLGAVGLRVRVIGAAPDNGPARLVVANHVSWLDPLVFGAVESLSPLAKREVGAWPVISLFARLQGAIFVDRRRRMQIPRVNRDMASRLRQGRSILFFPEGTTFDGTRRGRFLTSHLACLGTPDSSGMPPAEARVQPVAIAYSDPAAAWIGDATLLPHLWLILGRPGLVCTLRHGAVSRVERGFDRKALGVRLASEIESLLDPEAEEISLPFVPTASAA